MKSVFYFIAVLCATLTFVGSALAQFAGSTGGNIELYADDGVYSKGVSTLTGQVDVSQGDVRILADQMVIYHKAAANAGPTVGIVTGDIERIVATGNFYYITPEQEVRGNMGVYMASSGTFEVTGDVVMVQDDSVVRGKRLIYELSSQKVRVVSDCKGRQCGRQGRVAVLIKNTPNANAAADNS